LKVYYKKEKKSTQNVENSSNGCFGKVQLLNQQITNHTRKYYKEPEY